MASLVSLVSVTEIPTGISVMAISSLQEGLLPSVSAIAKWGRQPVLVEQHHQESGGPLSGPPVNRQGVLSGVRTPALCTWQSCCTVREDGGVSSTVA